MCTMWGSGRCVNGGGGGGDDDDQKEKEKGSVRDPRRCKDSGCRECLTSSRAMLLTSIMRRAQSFNL